ncbi:hypothetical protein BH09PLA1_BH09PLA1_29240 [soil metagenome]
MRSVVVILITIILLAGGFTLYSWMQPARAPRKLSRAPVEAKDVAPPATNPANQSLPISKGEKVFVESFDNKTGNLSRRFRGATWDPQPDGTVNVQQPEAEFFSNDGQVLRVRGERGEIVVPSGAGGADSISRAQLPTRGKIYMVQIALFPPGAKKPVLTCNVNNLSFDNDTFLLATEDFKDASGQAVPADQVPVVVRGDDYDFDGRGLTMHWDEKDQRLQLLEIAHGQSLTVKNPKALGVSTTQPTATKSSSVKPPPTSAPIVVTDGGAHPDRDSKTSTTAPSTQPDASPYRATFVENVRVEQGGQQVASCDQMNLDFLMDARDANDAPGAAPAPRASKSDRKPATNRARAPIAATTAPAEEPIRVLWSGKLTIQAAPIGTATPKGKDSIVEMIGVDRPVIAKSKDGELSCASFLLNTGDNSLSVRSSPAIPQLTVKDSTGVSITTESFDYSGEHHVAIVKGRSHAEFPIADASAPATQPLTQPQTQPPTQLRMQPGAPGAARAQFARVDWTDSCTLRTSPSQERGRMAIEHALLRGDVQVKHPQMTLSSQELELSFDPTSATPSTTAPTMVPAGDAAKLASAKLRQLIARDAVRGQFSDPTDAQARPQSIETDLLTVDFDKGGDGRSYPKHATASGAVRASDGKSELRAKHLQIAMKPTATTLPGAVRADSLAPVEVESLFAQQGVRATSVDGQAIQCEQLEMKQTAEGPRYTIQGELSAPARVSDGANSLVGPLIEFDPGAQHAWVRGPGTMRGTQQASSVKAASTQPIDISWQKGLDADGKNNLIVIDGAVVAKSTMEDGTVSEVLGKQMTITLADPATPKPARPAPTTQKSSSAFSFGGAGADMNAFRDKVFKLATVDSAAENSEVRSTLLAANGTLLRRMHLFAAKFQYEPQTRRMIVPVPGRMLYEDQRGPATQPADSKLNLRGATAFEWKTDFIYDDAARQATMSGDVDVVHRGSTNTDSYRMRAQRVVADLLPANAAARSAPAGSAPAAAGANEAKLKRLVADGGVTFSSSRVQFIADRVEYEPEKHLLTARGTDRAPATLLDAGGLSQGTFTDLYYDTELDRFRTENFRAAVRRTVGGGAVNGSPPDSEKWHTWR